MRTVRRRTRIVVQIRRLIVAAEIEEKILDVRTQARR